MWKSHNSQQDNIDCTGKRCLGMSFHRCNDNIWWFSEQPLKEFQKLKIFKNVLCFHDTKWQHDHQSFSVILKTYEHLDWDREKISAQVSSHGNITFMTKRRQKESCHGGQNTEKKRSHAVTNLHKSSRYKSIRNTKPQRFFIEIVREMYRKKSDSSVRIPPCKCWKKKETAGTVLGRMQFTKWKQEKKQQIYVQSVPFTPSLCSWTKIRFLFRKTRHQKTVQSKLDNMQIFSNKNAEHIQRIAGNWCFVTCGYETLNSSSFGT